MSRYGVYDWDLERRSSPPTSKAVTPCKSNVPLKLAVGELPFKSLCRIADTTAHQKIGGQNNDFVR